MYGLVTLDKSFPPLGPSILISNIREVVALCVCNGTLPGKCMGGVWLNGHGLGGPGLNGFIIVKVLCLLENTTEISTDIHTGIIIATATGLMSSELSRLVCAGACACVCFGTVCDCVCIFWCVCV